MYVRPNLDVTSISSGDSAAALSGMDDEVDLFNQEPDLADGHEKAEIPAGSPWLAAEAALFSIRHKPTMSCYSRSSRRAEGCCPFKSSLGDVVRLSTFNAA